MIGIFLPNMRNAHQLKAFLNEDVTLNPWPWEARALSSIALWGHSWRSWPGRLYARLFGLPTFRIEDGFLRSVGSPPHKQPHLSLIIDRKGIFYDATKETDLECLIRSTELNEGQLTEATEALEMIRTYNINKYNTSNVHSLWPASPKKRVLVVDQTWGDDSIRKGLASQKTFENMLKAACVENPEAELYFKPHPSTLSGRRWGNIDLKSAERLGYKILKEPCNSLSLLANMDHVYVATSLLGFEALMLEKKVTCFGIPFYAGWGLTDDRQPCPRRGVSRTLLEVFHAAYLGYPRYINPDHGQPATLKETLAYIVSGSERMLKDPSGEISLSMAGLKDATKSRRSKTRA